MLIKNVYKQHARKHEALLRLGLPTLARTCAIAADYSGHAEFFPQESLLLLHSRTSDFSAGNFKATCYSMPGLMWQGLSRPFCNRNIGWWDFSLEQVGISRTYPVTYLLCGRMKVPHWISIPAMEFESVHFLWDATLLTPT